MCRSCNNPMEGHKRPFGQPICPDEPAKASSPLREVFIPALPPGEVFHYVNPHFVDRNPPPQQLAVERADTPRSWVSTELADDAPIKQEPATYVSEYQLHQSVHIQRAGSVASSFSSTSSTYIRQIQEALSTSIPLASMFRTPRQDISSVTRAARAEGLYTALIPHARTDGEGGVLQATQAPLWKLVVGKDAGTVAELADMYDRDTIGTLGRASVPPSGLNVAAETWQLWVARYTIKCAIAGFTLWIFLWAFFAMV